MDKLFISEDIQTSLSHSIVFLYFFVLITEEGFLISPCYSLEVCIQMGISFLFSLAFLCKEIEETIEWERLEISRKLDTKGTFHAKMGTIKDRNGMDLTEAEDIKKRWQEYT